MRYLLSFFAALLTIACPALAQYGSTGYGNPLQSISESPPFTRADIRIMDSVLDLSPAQRELTDALHTDFSERYTEEMLVVRLKVEALVEEAIMVQDADTVFESYEIIREWNKRREELRAAFIEDLRLLLDKQQILLWHKVEAELRRKDEMGKGLIAGESIDLIRLVDAHIDDWTQSPEIAEELRRYAEHMDRLLIARQRLLESEDAKNFREIQTSDPEAALRLLEQSLGNRDRIVRLNVETLDRIGRALPEPDRDSLHGAFYQKAIDRIVPVSPIAKRIDAARSLPSLTDEQRERMDPALARFDAGSLGMKRTLFEALRQTQLDMLPESLHARLEGEQTDQPDLRPLLDDALAERAAYERAAWTAIKPVLTPNQLAELPELGTENIVFPNFSWFGL